MTSNLPGSQFTTNSASICNSNNAIQSVSIGSNFAGSTVSITAPAITLNGEVITNNVGICGNYTAPAVCPVSVTLTAGQLFSGLITSTSAAGVTLTLPTASILATAWTAAGYTPVPALGVCFSFYVYSSGANTVTIAAGAGDTTGPTPTCVTTVARKFTFMWLTATTGTVFAS